MPNVFGYFVVPYMILYICTYVVAAVVDWSQQDPRDAAICQQIYDIS